MKEYLLFITCLLLTFSCILKAQDTPFPQNGDLIEVDVRRGGDFIGYFLEENDSFLVINHIQVGELPFRREDIYRIRPLEKGRFFKGEYWPVGVSDHYYYSLPNAFTVSKGDIFYRNDWFYFNQLTYGASERLSIGLSFDAVSLFSILLDENLPPVLSLSPKYRLPINAIPGIQFATGAFILSLPDYVLDESDGPLLDAALVYGLATIGSRDRNLSLGLAYGYADREWSNQAAFFIGGGYRIARWLSLTGEAWVFPQYESSLGTAGFKIHTRKSSFQLALPLGTVDRDINIFPVPLISFATRLWNVYN